MLGTLDYIAPELLRGEEPGPSADLYALGCVVFECLAGSRRSGAAACSRSAWPISTTSPPTRAPARRRAAGLRSASQHRAGQGARAPPADRDCYAAMLIVAARSGYVGHGLPRHHLRPGRRTPHRGRARAGHGSRERRRRARRCRALAPACRRPPRSVGSRSRTWARATAPASTAPASPGHAGPRRRQPSRSARPSCRRGAAGGPASDAGETRAHAPAPAPSSARPRRARRARPPLPGERGAGRCSAGPAPARRAGRRRRRRHERPALRPLPSRPRGAGARRLRACCCRAAHLRGDRGHRGRADLLLRRAH